MSEYEYWNRKADESAKKAASYYKAAKRRGLSQETRTMISEMADAEERNASKFRKIAQNKRDFMVDG